LPRFSQFDPISRNACIAVMALPSLAFLRPLARLIARRGTRLGVPIITLEISGLRVMHHAIMTRLRSKDSAAQNFLALSHLICQSGRYYYMTITQSPERAGLIADQTYHNTGDVSNHKTFNPDQLRSVATVQLLTLQPNTSSSRRTCGQDPDKLRPSRVRNLSAGF